MHALGYQDVPAHPPTWGTYAAPVDVKLRTFHHEEAYFTMRNVDHYIGPHRKQVHCLNKGVRVSGLHVVHLHI